MKIAQINSVCGNGSTGKICVTLSEELSKNKIDNRIYYGIGNTRFENAEFFGSVLGTRIHQIKTRIFGYHGFYSNRETYNLLKKLQEFKPDIVHLHNLHGHYINVAMLFDFLKESNCRIIWTLHDCWPVTGHCVHFEYEHCYKWKNGCQDCTQLSTYPTTYFHDPSAKNWREKKRVFTSVENMTIVTVSEWLKQIVEQSYLNKYEIQRIFNGVNTSIFMPEDVSDLKVKMNLQDKFIILGMAGKWLDNRNRALFQEIQKKMSSEMRLVLIGNCSDVAKEKHENVVFVDRINDPVMLARFYNLADVFVNLSYEDTFGLVNAEAMACGTPIISFDSTACGEVVGNDGTCGMTVSVSTRESLYDCIQKIKEKGKSFYTENCRERARLLFDDEIMKSQYMSLYRNIYKEVGKTQI